MPSSRSPKDLIRLYWGRVWNEREPELIREICADPIIRHDPMSTTPLSHDEQIARVRHQSSQSEPYFTHEVLLADDTYVCSVWNMFTRKGEPIKISGIEVFKAENGRFTDCWNSAYAMTYWGRDTGTDDPLQPRPPRRPWAGQGAQPAADRSPAELVRRFHEGIWNTGDVSGLADIVADPLIRYEPAGLKSLSLDALKARIAAQHEAAAPVFEHEILLANDEYACVIWNMRTTKGEPLVLSGIETFRAENGKLVECWSPPETKGAWGRRGDAAVPKDLPPPRLLSSVSEIDNIWMQSVFAQAGVTVPRIAMVRTRPIGHGNLSSTVQAIVGYNQAITDEPQSVVCKFHTDYAEAQPIIARANPYTTEVSAYDFFGADPPMRTPRVYLAQVSPDGMVVNLVLEDLGAFCEAGDQLAGCGQAEAAAVVAELARMHRMYWNRGDLADLPWTVEKRRTPSETPNLYAGGVAIFRDRYSQVLTAEDMATIEAFVPLVEAWMNLTSPTPTLIHSDPRVDNIMFDRRDPAAIRAYIIDWQCVNRGDAQFDVAYFLSGSLSPEDRRACERRLIAAHAATIAEVDPGYTERLALEAYRRNIVSGLYTTVVASNVMPHTPHNQDLLTTLAERNCAAVRDWDGLTAIATANA